MIEINNEVKKIMELVEASGYEIYLVGGFVRDSIIGKDNKDYDLCTNMPFNKLSELIPEMKVMRENNHRNTCVFRRNGEDIEISTFRGVDLNADLICRDFTINSIALNSKGEIIDLVNGCGDIKNKIISLSDKSGNGFRIDPLRILRAIRFAGVLGYEIDDDTYQHMIDKKELLSNVACERIYAELSKILLCDRAGDLINKYKEVICEIVPELKPLIGFEQNNPFHMYDVFNHTMEVLNNTSRKQNLRFAALFHDIGKPYVYSEDENGIGHFYGHPKVSASKFTEFAMRMKMDKKSMISIQKLIFFHDVTLGEKTKSINKFIQLFGEQDVDILFELKLADIMGQHPDKLSRVIEINNLREMYINYLNSSPVLKIKDLDINGNDLKLMNFDGKIIGVILNDVLDMVGSERLNNNKTEIQEYVDGKYR